MTPLFLIAQVALAGTPVDDLSALLEGPSGPPKAAMSCGPIEGIGQSLGQNPMLGAMLAHGGQDTPGSFMAGMLLDPAAARTAGLDPSGNLQIASWSDPTHTELRIPFSGTVVQAHAFLERLGMSVTGIGTHTWRTDHGSFRQIRLEEGQLIAGLRPDQADGSTTPRRALLAELPGSTSCVGYADDRLAAGKELGEKASKGKLPEIVGMSLFLPFDDAESLRLRAQLKDTAAPKAFAQGGAPPLGGSSSTRPLVVMSLGVPLLDLVADAAIGELSPKSLRELAQMRELMDVGPGTTIAFFGVPPKVQMVGTLSVQDHKGRPIKAKKIMRALKAKGKELGPLETTEDGLVAVQQDELRMLMGATHGRVWFGNQETALREAIAGEGTPWISPAFGAFANEWPLAFEGSPPAAGMPFGRIRGGLRSNGGTWELAIGPEKAGPIGFSSLVATLAVPNFLEMQRRAKRAELPSTLAGLRAAVDAFIAREGRLPDLPPAPRTMSELDGSKARWAPEGDWAQVWSGAQSDVRGSYWLEPVGDAYRLHGALDGDGNGIPARYVLDSRSEQGPERVSADDAF